MKSNEDKLKEWDDIDKLMKMLDQPNIIRSDEEEIKTVKFIADENNPILERFKKYNDYFAPMYGTRGVQYMLPYVKHAVPFVEYMKVRYPKLLGPKNNHGVMLQEMYIAFKEYRDKENLKFPDFLDPGSFIELFFYLLRSMNLMKEEQVSAQWWWEILVEKK